MEMSTLIILGGVIIGFLSILVYALLAIFFPEWVGITGKVARSAEQSHQEGNENKPPSSFVDKL